MSCAELFEFASYPPHSSLYLSEYPDGSESSWSPPSSPNSSWYADQIPSLERDFCSNFACCGHVLANLHELIDHFEEAHVVVVDVDGRAVHPSLVSGHVTAFKNHGDSSDSKAGVNSFSRVILEYPTVQPLPLDPSDQSTSHSQTNPPSKDDISNEPETIRPPHSSKTLGLPPSSFVAPSEKVVPDSLAFPIRSEKRRQRGQGLSKHRRDKLYRCPRPKCTKSYLNPNGLKYHLEKGTCKVEPSFSRDKSHPPESANSSELGVPIKAPYGRNGTSSPKMLPL